jgi:DNA-binding XRE family transcriptional regulator
MGYHLRMHGGIGDWLTNLRAAEPELARLVGEAVVALLDAGEGLGPPLVVSLESVLRQPDDPREALDFSYARQLEILQQVRRGVAAVATSRKRVELQVGQLEESAAKLAGEGQDAADSGDDGLARQARARESGIQEQLADLRRQLSSLENDEERLTAASQRLQAKVDEFRTRKETMKARYTAAEAAWRIREAFIGIGEDTGDLDMPGGPESESLELDSDLMAASAVPGLPGTSGDISGAADQAGTPVPRGMMELRPGAPGREEVGLLFAIEPAETVVLVAWVENPGGQLEEYRDVVPDAAARLELARSAAGPSSAAFISFDADAFLDEFFPGEETEVEIGAAALVARDRARTLAQARERTGLTQAQVAARMNVREERVAAIERAEPGAAEVRTLAAYVQALGGRLEIMADIGDERIRLR